MKKNSNKNSGARYRTVRWIIIVVTLCIVAGALYFFTRSDRHVISPDMAKNQLADNKKATSTAAPGSEETPKSVTRQLSVEVRSDTLLGRWYRTDGEYMIQVSSIGPEGKVEAGYFNPRPINVSKAEAYPEQPPRLFIELQDAGYDGSNYNLTYDVQNDVLRGNYYQATYGQTYSVIFMRRAGN